MDINSYTPKYSGLHGRSLISFSDYSSEEIYEILYTARLLKMKQTVKEKQPYLKDKTVMFISKSQFSATRLAFEMAVKQLYGDSIMLGLGGSQLESMLEDVDFLPVAKRHGVGVIVVSTDEIDDAMKLRGVSPIPVINAHGKRSPLVALAALLTCWEKFGKLRGLNIAIIGNEKKRSYLLHSAVKCGMNVHSVSPASLSPTDETLDYASIYGSISTFNDVEAGVKNCQIVYVAGDNIGEEFKVTADVMDLAHPSAIFLHPTPVNRQTEADADVADGESSFMLSLAENLLHVEKAVLTLIAGENTKE